MKDRTSFYQKMSLSRLKQGMERKWQIKAFFWGGVHMIQTAGS